MKKQITFGRFTAKLNADDNRVMLTVKHKCLPLKLADKLNESGNLDALEVFFNDDKQGCIRIVHDLPMDELADIVCNSISTIYDTDVSVSNARIESVV